MAHRVLPQNNSTGRGDQPGQAGPVPPDPRETRVRNVILNSMAAVAILMSLFFGIRDMWHGRYWVGAISFAAVLVFGLLLLVNILVPRLAQATLVTFAGIVGATLLALLATQFPDPAIVFWCFPFPLVALFLLGRRAGGIVVIAYNAAVMAIFLFGLHDPAIRYTFDYAVRYCGVMFAISVLAYHYERLRSSTFAEVRTLNQTLEQRVQERTRALEESQARLRQAEKLEAIGLLAGGVAHDFNNQLTGVIAYADSIRMTAAGNAELLECADGIIACARRSSELTQQLLAFARKGNVLTAPVDVHVVIANVVTLLGRTIDKRITLKQELRAERATVLGDPAQLENALINLALNARDAIAGEGEIAFATSVVTLDETYRASAGHDITPGAYVRVSVTDTGCGMDRTTLDRIFEPFFTTKEPGKGTGMGLAAVYGTVRSLGGAITVYSEPGRGTSFHLYLPLLAADAPAAPAPQPVPLPQGQGHVLLIDDEPAVAASVEKMLRQQGFAVTVFHNSTEAIAFYREHWQSVDAVLLDMVMPPPGGKETFAALKQVNPDAAVLLASGYSLNGEARSILDMGARGFVQKPFVLSDLCDSLRRAMRRNQ